MFMVTAALADDADDVKEQVLEFFAAANAGDTETVYQHKMPEQSSFGRGIGLLSRATSLEEQKRAFQASVDAGVKRNYQLKHLEVRVYGDTAVVTFYLTGPRTEPDGTTLHMNERRTGVWIRQGRAWKEVHSHQSPLGVPQ
jgi:ketosteroid isomerase-like protein